MPLCWLLLLAIFDDTSVRSCRCREAASLRLTTRRLTLLVACAATNCLKRLSIKEWRQALNLCLLVFVKDAAAAAAAPKLLYVQAA